MKFLYALFTDLFIGGAAEWLGAHWHQTHPYYNNNNNYSRNKHLFHTNNNNKYNNNYIVFVSFVSFVSFVKLFVNIYFVCKMFVKIRSRSPFSSFLPCQISSLSHPIYKRHRLYKFVQNFRYLYHLYCLYHLYFCKLFVKFQAHSFVFL